MKTGNGSAVQVLPAVTDYYVHYRSVSWLLWRLSKLPIEIVSR
jgi:hypothetical protein